MRNAPAYAGKTRKRIVSAWVGAACARDDSANAPNQWRNAADQTRPRLPKLAGLLDEAEFDILACMDFPAQRKAEIRSTNPLERFNDEIKRRADIVGTFLARTGCPTTQPAPLRNSRRPRAARHDPSANERSI